MKKLIFLLIASLTFSACKKDRFDPEPPTIEFGGWKHVQQDADGHDKLVELIINFKDRNGDIGRHELEQIDRCGKPVYDLFIYYEKKENNAYAPAYWNQPDSSLDDNCNIIPGSYQPMTQINFRRSLDYVQPEGNNRSIEGEIAYELDYESALSNLFPIGRCRVYLLDRARNKSNEIYTEDLVIN